MLIPFVSQESNLDEFDLPVNEYNYDYEDSDKYEDDEQGIYHI